MLKKDEGRLDFTRDAHELERQVRAMNPWPGAFMDFDGAILKIHRAHVTPLPLGEGVGVRAVEVGQRLTVANQPAIGAGGGLLVLDEVQPAGKKPMSGNSFLAGARHW
jgi:methionyl-tRNA formyltransferase